MDDNTYAVTLAAVEQHLATYGMSATRFGRNAVGDPRLVLDMRLGRSPGRQMMLRIQSYMQSGTPLPAKQRIQWTKPLRDKAFCLLAQGVRPRFVAQSLGVSGLSLASMRSRYEHERLPFLPAANGAQARAGA